MREHVDAAAHDDEDDLLLAGLAVSPLAAAADGAAAEQRRGKGSLAAGAEAAGSVKQQGRGRHAPVPLPHSGWGAAPKVVPDIFEVDLHAGKPTSSCQAPPPLPVGTSKPAKQAAAVTPDGKGSVHGSKPRQQHAAGSTKGAGGSSQQKRHKHVPIPVPPAIPLNQREAPAAGGDGLPARAGSAGAARRRVPTQQQGPVAHGTAGVPPQEAQAMAAGRCAAAASPRHGTKRANTGFVQRGNRTAPSAAAPAAAAAAGGVKATAKAGATHLRM
ncbi:hypothetical protein COO60DRAFT_355008 [Scenedesmus sp. NREL 46B-D3]|nr:hypothetical protein COO60DRAFT_355008 [Scenedesmus sp. NREL 46B-D3]